MKKNSIFNREARDKKRIQNKSRKRKDFSEQDLPSNRFSLFWDCLIVRYDVFLKIALIIFLFSLPFMACQIWHTILMNNLRDSFLSEKITLQEYYSFANFWNIIITLIQLVSLFIIAIGLSGVSRIIKRLVYYEPIQFKHDFYIGQKENIKPTLLTFLVLGIAFAISIYLIRFTQVGGLNDFASTLIYFLPLVFSVMFLFPILFLTLAEIPIYKNTFKGYFKNSFYFYAKNPFITIGVCLIIIAPVLLFLINNVYFLLIYIVCYFFLIIPISLIGFHIYSTYVFDKYLNKEQYKEIYDKGIYRIKKKKDDEQEIIDKINKEEDI